MKRPQNPDISPAAENAEAPAHAVYAGTDNLEVMRDAVNYTRFQLALIREHCDHHHRILDFGAGIGTFAEHLALDGYKVTCLEPDPDQSRILAAKGLNVIREIHDLDNEAYDLIYSLNVLEHIEDDLAVLRALHRKMKPGACLLLYVPAFPVLFSSMDSKVGHYRRYTRRSLAKQVGAAGFHVLQNRYVDCIGFAASLVYKLRSNGSGDLNRSALVFYDRVAFPISQRLDRIFNRLAGKNLLLIAERGQGDSENP